MSYFFNEAITMKGASDKENEVVRENHKRTALLERLMDIDLDEISTDDLEMVVKVLDNEYECDECEDHKRERDEIAESAIDTLEDIEITLHNTIQNFESVVHAETMEEMRDIVSGICGYICNGFKDNDQHFEQLKRAIDASGLSKAYKDSLKNLDFTSALSKIKFHKD